MRVHRPTGRRDHRGRDREHGLGLGGSLHARAERAAPRLLVPLSRQQRGGERTTQHTVERGSVTKMITVSEKQWTSRYRTTLPSGDRKVARPRSRPSSVHSQRMQPLSGALVLRCARWAEPLAGGFSCVRGWALLPGAKGSWQFLADERRGPPRAEHMSKDGSHDAMGDGSSSVRAPRGLPRRAAPRSGR